MLEQTVVNFVPTGMIPTRARTPHVPVHADEIVTSVRAACELGISMVHLHAREPDSGRPTLAADIYAEIIAGMINYARYLAKKGLVRPPYSFNLILGNIACAQADLLHTGVMLRDLPEGST
jgi:uncharacterized protein (DUF849 family)